jgi:flavin reductase (DIM6/NTAB) family NADH-FMN oxidoreductase RutF
MSGILYHEQYRVATDRNGARVGRTGSSRKIPRKAGKQPETSLPTDVSESIPESMPESVSELSLELIPDSIPESIPESITETTSFASGQFKAVMSRFTTGVTVVTTRLGAMRAGITVNAFCSVSLDPPLVLICIDRASRVHDLLIQAGIFAVNLLTTRQEEVARCFAGQTERRWLEFCGCQTHIVATGAPVFDESLGFVDCHITDVFAGGDHSIILGQVEALGTSEGEPLLYYRSRYVAQRGARHASRSKSRSKSRPEPAV